MDPKAKFFDDLITGLPILSRSSPEISEFIRTYNLCFASKGSGSCDTEPLFDPAKEDLQQLITNLSDIFNNLKDDIYSLNTNIDAKLHQIDSEKTLKDVNSGIFTNINTSNSGAKIMIDDYKSSYNSQYYKNVELFIGVILLIGLSFKIFRK
jgi:hypothetical protein